MTPDGRVVDPLLEGALIMRDRFGTTPESHLFAKIVTTFTADCALAAGHTNFKGHPVTNVEARHLGPYGNDDTRGFVA